MACGSYTSDLTAGQTFSESHYFSPRNAAQLFDEATGSDDHWHVNNPTISSEWFQVQFSAAKRIAKIRIRGCLVSWYGANTQADQFIVKASNTGAFAGEEVTLFTSASGLTWTDLEWKQCEWDNSTAYLYYRIFCSRKNASTLALSECEMMECSEVEADLADVSGIGDSCDSFSLTDSVSDSAGIGDSADAYNTDSHVADVFGLSDQVDASGDWFTSDSDVAGIGDTADAGFEAEGDFSDVAGFGDAIDGFNWSEWVRANRDLAVIRYYCTLTGAADGLSDLTIPISSFQASKRTGESTYLSVVTPGVAQAADIALRSNGEIVIEMAYLVNGVQSVREEILRVDLEQINPYEGSRNRSINLIGHKTVTYDARAKSIQGCSYKYRSGGSRGFRFPQADPYLNPGDALTVVDTDDVFTVDYITYAIAAQGAKFMEVRE